jgi:hypothetical protein
MHVQYKEKMHLWVRSFASAVANLTDVSMCKVSSTGERACGIGRAWRSRTSFPVRSNPPFLSIPHIPTPAHSTQHRVRAARAPNTPRHANCLQPFSLRGVCGAAPHAGRLLSRCHRSRSPTRAGPSRCLPREG